MDDKLTSISAELPAARDAVLSTRDDVVAASRRRRARYAGEYEAGQDCEDRACAGHRNSSHGNSGIPVEGAAAGGEVALGEVGTNSDPPPLAEFAGAGDAGGCSCARVLVCCGGVRRVLAGVRVAATTAVRAG